MKHSPVQFVYKIESGGFGRLIVIVQFMKHSPVQFVYKIGSGGFGRLTVIRIHAH